MRSEDHYTWQRLKQRLRIQDDYSACLLLVEAGIATKPPLPSAEALKRCGVGWPVPGLDPNTKIPTWDLYQLEKKFMEPYFAKRENYFLHPELRDERWKTCDGTIYKLAVQHEIRTDPPLPPHALKATGEGYIISDHREDRKYLVVDVLVLEHTLYNRYWLRISGSTEGGGHSSPAEPDICLDAYKEEHPDLVRRYDPRQEDRLTAVRKPSKHWLKTQEKVLKEAWRLRGREPEIRKKQIAEKIHQREKALKANKEPYSVAEIMKMLALANFPSHGQGAPRKRKSKGRQKGSE